MIDSLYLRQPTPFTTRPLGHAINMKFSFAIAIIFAANAVRGDERSAGISIANSLDTAMDSTTTADAASASQVSGSQELTISMLSPTEATESTMAVMNAIDTGTTLIPI